MKQQYMLHVVGTAFGVPRSMIKWGSYDKNKKKTMGTGTIFLLGKIGEDERSSPVAWMIILLIMMIVYSEHNTGASVIDLARSP